MKNILDTVTRFDYKSGNTKRNAQINLEGRTHWADDDTLSFFGCRINRAFDDAGGKMFAVCYSQKAGFDDSLLYSTDAADEEDSVNLRGCRLLKKKKLPC